MIFHKSQKSERMQDHEIAILDGDLKLDFFSKKWGFIQENPQKLDFSHYLGSIQEWGSINADTVVQMVAGKSLIPDQEKN